MAEIILNKDNFESEVLKSDMPVLVDFWAAWCGPCKMLAPTIAELAEEYEGKVKVCVVNVTHAPKAAAKYAVRGVPTMLFFKDAKHSSQLVGEEPIKVIEEKIKGII